VKSAKKVGGELVAQVVVIMVFTCCYDTVAGAVRYDIHLPPVFNALLDDLMDSLADSYVA